MDKKSLNAECPPLSVTAQANETNLFQLERLPDSRIMGSHQPALHPPQSSVSLCRVLVLDSCLCLKPSFFYSSQPACVVLATVKLKA